MEHIEGPGRAGKMAMAGAFAFLLTGCGAIAEQATEQLIEEAIEAEAGEDVEIDFDTDDGQIVIETDDGTAVFDADDDGSGSYSITGDDGEESEISFGQGVERPDCLPNEIQLPDGFEANNAMSADGLCVYSGWVKTQLDLDATVAEYTQVMEGIGLTNLSTNTWSQNDRAGATVTATDDDGAASSVSVSWEPEWFDYDGNEFPATLINITLTGS